MGFGVRLKELLKQKGMTIKELSEKSGISINTLYSITKRDTQIPDNEIVKKIAEILQVDVNELLTYDIIKEDLKISIAEVKSDEEKHRQRLFKICKYLNSIALLQLTKLAIDMLQDDTNRSFVNELNE